MEIALAIKKILPNLIRGNDYEVFDDNNDKGPYIKWLNTTIPQPTQAELDTAWIEVEKEQALVLLKKQKSIDINKIATLSDQLNLLASVLDTITSATPDQTIIDNAKAKFAEIKAILNK